MVSSLRSPVMSIRPASHAGSWYPSNPQMLLPQISHWLDSNPPFRSRFVLGPHAGLKFCGSVLGETYAALDPNIKRIFILSPSHVKYFVGFRTSRFHSYDTPLGPVQVDSDITTALHGAGIKYLDSDNDTREHGVEMHLPFIKTVAPHAVIVPLVFCDMQDTQETVAIDLLAAYLDDPENAFAVSTDFCHWGPSFDYQLYRESADGPLLDLSRKSTKVHQPIYKSIEQLDRQGMAAASSGDAKIWRNYITATGNTVCGQKPLEVLMSTANSKGHKLEYKWMGYAQSSQITNRNDMSVSYASAVASYNQVS